MKKQWIILLSLIVLLILGISLHLTKGDMFSSGDYAFNYFASGRFSMGVFSSGMFSVGIFSIGIFSVGIFSVSIFNIALYGLGFFIVAKHKRVPKVEVLENEDDRIVV